MSNLTKEQMADLKEWIRTPGSYRILDLFVIQLGGIFSATTNGSDGRNLVSEGRKGLGFDILAAVEAAQPVQDPDGAPTLTLMHMLQARAQSQPEKPNAKRFDRTTELDDDPNED